MSEHRILRTRVLDLEGAIDSGYSPPSEGTPTLIVRVYDGGSMPVAVDHYFACHPVELDGDPTEGGTGTPVVDTASTVFVDVIGSRVPVAGDYLKCFFIGGRWVAEDGGGHVDYVCPNCTACDDIRLALDGTVTDDNGSAAIHYDIATSSWHTRSGLTSFGLTWPSAPVGEDGCVAGTEDVPYGYDFRCAGTPGTFIAGVNGHSAYVTSPGGAFVGYNIHPVTGTCGGSVVTVIMTPVSQDCGTISVTFSIKAYLGTVVPPNPAAVEIPAPSTTATFTIAPEAVPPSVCCYPCPIPSSDLTLSWIAPDTSTGSTTLTFGSAGDAFPWTSGCVGPINGFMVRFKLTCVDGTVTMRVENYLTGDCSGSPLFIATNDYTTLADFACKPFHLHWDTGSGLGGGPTDVLIDS